MEHEITLEYSEPLLREAIAGFWRRSVGLGLMIALPVVATLLGVLLFLGDRSWVVGAVGAALLGCTTVVGAIYIVHYRSAMRKFRGLGSTRATFRATDDSFTVSSAAGTSTLPWSSVTEIWKLQNCWLLLFSGSQFITLPLANIPEDARTFIVENVIAAGGKSDA